MKNAVVNHNGFHARLAVIRAEADERHAQALAEGRSAVDARITELVQYRALAAVDAMLTTT